MLNPLYLFAGLGAVFVVIAMIALLLRYINKAKREA